MGKCFFSSILYWGKKVRGRRVREGIQVLTRVSIFQRQGNRECQNPLGTELKAENCHMCFSG